VGAAGVAYVGDGGDAKVYAAQVDLADLSGGKTVGVEGGFHEVEIV
jgi:hypothetical protein